MKITSMLCCSLLLGCIHSNRSGITIRAVHFKGCLHHLSCFSCWGLVQALASQAKLDHAEEMKKEIEMCQKIAAERSQNKYDKHFAICKDIMGQMVDFATKVEEYRQLTGKYVTVAFNNLIAWPKP